MMHVNTDVQSEGKQRKTFSAMSNLHTDCCLKLDFEKLDQNRRSNCLIFGTKHRKDDQLQSLERPIEYHSWEHKFDIKESDGCMVNLIYYKKVQGQKQPMGWAMAEPKIPNVISLNPRSKGMAMDINIPVMIVIAIMVILVKKAK